MQKLEKIAERLQLPLNELINQSVQESDTLVSPKVNTNFQLISKIRKLLEHRNYHALELLIEKHQEEINRASSNYEVTFFRWINATLYYHQYQDIQKALDMLEAIDISPKEQPELSLEIVNARVRLFYLDEQFGEALNIINQTIELTNNETIDFKIRAKFLFNYSLISNKLQHREETLNSLNEGIDLLIEHNSLFLLGDFYYQKGVFFQRIKEFNSAHQYYLHAKSLFTIKQNEQFKNLTELRLNELNNYKKE